MHDEERQQPALLGTTDVDELTVPFDADGTQDRDAHTRSPPRWIKPYDKPNAGPVAILQQRHRCCGAATGVCLRCDRRREPPVITSKEHPMDHSRTVRALTALGVACSLVASACSSDPTTTADSPPPTTAVVATPATTTATTTPAPVTTATPSTPPTTAVPSTVADVSMEAFASDVAEICAASPLLSLPPTDGTVETAEAQIAMLREADNAAMKVEDLVVPAALQPQQDAIIELVAAGDAALADAEAAVAAGDGALAAQNMELNLEIRKRIGVRWAIMGASCGPITAERAAAAALNVPLERNPEQISMGFGSVWFSEGDGGTVVRVDPDTGEVLARIEVGEQPRKLQPADGRMWVRTQDAFVRIDPGRTRSTRRC